MNKSIKSAQGGFTLIELIVVIVILGILAATALPRFTNLSGDARLASLNAARGALSATAAMTHGRFLVTPSELQNVEGAQVSMNMASGYPAIITTARADARAGLLQAAGLEQDYVALDPTPTATATSPVVAEGTMVIVPRNIRDTATAVTCFLTYTPATAANAVPTVAVTGSADACR